MLRWLNEALPVVRPPRKPAANDTLDAEWQRIVDALAEGNKP